MTGYSITGSTISLRLIEATNDDAMLVTRWRNTESARKAFFSDYVVTPDSHFAFLAKRKPHDLVFIIEYDYVPVGMCSLTVDVLARTAEYGRLFIDEDCRGKDYALHAEFTVLSYAFDMLRLESIWGSVLESNVPVLKLHKKTGFLIDEDKSSLEDKGKVIRVYYTAGRWRELL
jgi:RimJ/RimL family protein N-acetyltransferase